MEERECDFSDMIEMPNQSAAANRRPALQLDGSDNLSATLAADRAFSILRSSTATEDGPAAVAELGRYA
jgi:hypothetical protein